MRHGCSVLARQVAEALSPGQELPWDVLFATSMLDLAGFIGLAPRALASLPRVAYFHENQAEYPLRAQEPRDVHFLITHLTTCLAADEVWFNSAYNQRTLLEGLGRLMKQVPDYRDSSWVEAVRKRGRIEPPGVPLVAGPSPSDAERSASLQPVERAHPPLHVLWAARWEHDKDPITLFRALAMLVERGVPFRVSVLGERFGQTPACFDAARWNLEDRVVHFGFAEDRATYEAALRQADVFVSTALHEYFGIAVVEAASAGCHLVLPDRLVYPELHGAHATLYAAGAENLAAELARLSQLKSVGALYPPSHEWTRGFDWQTRASELDAALGAVHRSRQLENA
jgi:glycosyltransferase involved in cell wall biosynthesis